MLLAREDGRIFLLSFLTHICCAIPCRAAASLGHVRPCTLPRLFLALLVLLATLRQKHRVPAYLLRNTMSRSGKPRSRTSVYAPSALPRAPRLACNSASKAPRTRIFAAQYHVAQRQASVTYVRVRSLGSSSRSSSCLQLCVKSTAYLHICCAIPCECQVINHSRKQNRILRPCY